MNFFGQASAAWRQDLLEEYFLLQMHLGMSYESIRNLPISYRRWFIERLTKHFEQKKSAYNKASGKSTGQSSPNPTSDIDMGKVKKFFNSKIKN